MPRWIRDACEQHGRHQEVVVELLLLLCCAVVVFVVMICVIIVLLLWLCYHHCCYCWYSEFMGLILKTIIQEAFAASSG